MKSETIIPCVGGFLLGLLAMHGVALIGNNDRRDEMQAAAARTQLPEARQSGAATTGFRHSHDLTGLIRLWPELKKGDPKMMRELERLDATALKSLIADIARGLEGRKGGEWHALVEVLQYAAGLLFKLEGEKAMSWAMENVEAEWPSQCVMFELVNAAARESSEAGKRMKDVYEKHSGYYRNHFTGFTEGAAYQGAEEALRLDRLLGTLPQGFGNDGFPDDFDFHGLITELAKKPRVGVGGYFGPLVSTVSYWSAKDPEAAWKGISEAMTITPEAGYFVADYIEQMREQKGDHEASSFLAERFGEIPKEARATVLEYQCYRFPQAAVELISLLPEVEDRKMLARYYLHPRNRPDDALRALQALGPESLQVETLLTSARQAAGGLDFGNDREEARDFIAGLLDEADLSPDNRVQIEAALSAIKVRE